MDALCDDLTAEHDDLDRDRVGRRPRASPTPAPGWTVGDQISHLWFFDQRAMLALTDPDGVRRDAEQIRAALAGAGRDPSVEQGRALAPRRAARALATRPGPPRRPRPHRSTRGPRVPWYGPAMSARSFITARLMETWAHGQDVVDALGAERPPTERLRHVAHIGVGARPFSYVANGREPNPAPVRVELVAPSGDEWTWGPDDAPDRVTGPALDFCLLVTQRRHRDDVDARA